MVGLKSLLRLILHTCRVFLLVAVGWLLCGCNRADYGKAHGRRAVITLMDSAEAVMNDAPEHSLELLDNIDSKAIRSRALNARYALLYSETLYKNGIDVDSDSLIMIAVRYYSDGKHTGQLFRSFYILGCIYNELGQLTNAAVTLGQAEQLSDQISDCYRIGLMYTQFGEVFFNSFDINRAEHYYRLAMDNYTKAGKEAHRMHALYDIAGCLMQQKRFDSAYLLLKEVQEWAATHNERAFESSCMLSGLKCLINSGDIESATDAFNKYAVSFGLPVNDSYVYSLFATLCISTGQYSDAACYLGDGWKYAVTKNDSIDLWYSESLLDEQRGRYDSALVKYKHTIELQNKNLYTLLDQPVLGAQKDYYRNLAETESLRASRNRRTVVLLISSFLFVMTILFLVNRAHRLQFEADKAELMLTIKDLRLKEDSNNETINHLSSRVNDLFSRPYEELDNIFEKMMETDDLIDAQNNIRDANKKEAFYNKKVNEFYRHVKEKFDEILSEHNQQELDRIINSSCHNIMTRLKDERLNLTKQDLLILRLSIVGFSPKTISRLTNIQFKTVHQQRRRAIQKISDSSADMANEIVKVLRMS